MKHFYTILLLLTVSSCWMDSTDKNVSETSMENYLFVGTYSRTEGHVDGKGQGIHILKWNEADQSLSEHMVIKGPINPSYIALHPSMDIVYTVNEIADNTTENIGLVQAYKFDLEGMSYGKISEQSSMGDAPCHISISEDGRFLFVANYVGGSIATYRIGEDGSISEPVGSYINEKTTPTTPRQEAGHAHMIRPIPNSSNFLVSDLGTDELLTFRFLKDGSIQKKHSIVTKQYGGPRHFDFHPTKPIVYALNELSPSITAIVLENSIPQSIIQQLEIPIKKEGDPVYSSAIKAHPNSKTLYAATRGLNGTAQNEIVVCAINESGELKITQTISTEGDIPRDFTITPSGDYLIAGNQDSDEIAIYKIDAETGQLKLVRADQKSPTPVCFVWR